MGVQRPVDPPLASVLLVAVTVTVMVMAVDPRAMRAKKESKEDNHHYSYRCRTIS